MAKQTKKKPPAIMRIEGIGTGAASARVLGVHTGMVHENSTFTFDPPRTVKRVHAVRDGDGINLAFEEE